MEWLSNLWAWLTSLDDKLYEVVEYIVDFAKWLVDFVVVLFSILGDFLLGLFLKFLDMVLSAVVALLDLIEIPFDPSTYYGMIPGDVASVLGAIGLPQAMSMIVAAILIRLVLQLIPFTRLGS